MTGRGRTGGGERDRRRHGPPRPERRRGGRLAASVVQVLLIAFVLVISALPAVAASDTVSNQGFVVDTLGQRLDAHDGMILQYNGLFVLFGTSYECSVAADDHPPAPYCGVKVYWSSNLARWHPFGSYQRYFAFDPQLPAIVSACPTDDCFRPHVVYDPATRLWVMWINTGQNHGYLVLTSARVNGPYVVASNISKLGAGSYGYGDETVTVSHGTGWLVYTERIHALDTVQRDLVVQRLNPSLTGTASGPYRTKLNERVAGGSIEAPALFNRATKDNPHGLWYLVYSDPSCAYCPGTGAAYATAKSPVGPWIYRGVFSSTSCGGQTAAVNVLKGIDVWQVDRWAPRGSQYSARNYLAPLEINGVTGLIPQQGCVTKWTLQ